MIGDFTKRPVGCVENDEIYVCVAAESPLVCGGGPLSTGLLHHGPDSEMRNECGYLLAEHTHIDLLFV